MATPRKITPELFRITEGALGPVRPCEIELRPLTLFIGPQGTGKSLVAQVLYAFRALERLAPFVWVGRNRVSDDVRAKPRKIEPNAVSRSNRGERPRSSGRL